MCSGPKKSGVEGKAYLRGLVFLNYLALLSRLRLILHKFFSGKENEKHSVSKGHSDLETARRNSIDGRLWTNVLLGLNVLFFVAQMATHGKLMLWGAKINSLIDKGQFWRFATSSLLHANIGHLMINCYSLNSIGSTVESISGPGRFLSVYFTSAVTTPAVGASGAIFGLAKLCLPLGSRSRQLSRLHCRLSSPDPLNLLSTPLKTPSTSLHSGRGMGINP
ncbi:hypothetical protein C5167_020322 [Papaver somniferum]|uniref:Peptidase S54 rhomboid domain-containing protein n=1 Tax=Papaver somniferum TaxID=3469 RepID=A0A4Y7IWV7_PAPSO|nr:hypothetical protein C5167_020322 [Papaver somniferum]